MSRRVFNVSQSIVFADGTMQYAFRDFVQSVDRVLVQTQTTADGAVQLGDDVSDLVNDAGYLTAYAPPVVRDEATDPYTLVTGDANAVIRLTATDADITIPVEASVSFPTGTEISIRFTGSGTHTLTTTGLTINGTVPTLTQHLELKFRKVGSDEWDLV